MNNQMLKFLMHNAIEQFGPQKIVAVTCRYVTSPHTYIETLMRIRAIVL